jgi:hypothetical protein
VDGKAHLGGAPGRGAVTRWVEIEREDSEEDGRQDGGENGCGGWVR